MSRRSSRASTLPSSSMAASVRASSSGWISRRAVDPGQFVRKGDHLIAYDRLERVRIRFQVALADLVHLGVGAPVVVEIPDLAPARPDAGALASAAIEGYRGAAIRAEVARVFPRLDPQSRLGRVEVVLPNPDRLLRPGTWAVGHFVTRRVEAAWVVPVRALTPMPDGSTAVFVAPAFSDQGAVEARTVRVGLRAGSEVQILEGLEEPAFVVTRGNRSIVDGATVEVVARSGGAF